MPNYFSDSSSEQLPSVEEVRTMQAAAAAMRDNSDTSVSSKHTNTSDIETAFSGSNNDENDNVHDQLPSVDEIRMSHSSYGDNNNNNRRCLKMTLWIALLVILTVIAVSLGVVLSTEDAEDAGATDFNNEDYYMGETGAIVDVNPPALEPEETVTTEAPEETVTTEAPPNTTTDAPAPDTLIIENRREAILEMLTSVGVSSKEDLETSGSPQQLALDFVADQDLAPVDLSMTDHLLERYVAAVFFYSTNGPSWQSNLNFLTNKTTCEWFINGLAADSSKPLKYGLSCSKDNTVTHVHIPSTFLVGDLPMELKFFMNLEQFQVFNNPGITGGFPAFLKDMSNINYIGLHYCELIGPLPAWLGDMTSLKSLVLSNNNFSGELPSSMADLVQLENLYLDDCNFSGDIQVLGSLAQLENVVLEDNEFTGTMDDDLVGTWTNLKSFDASHNRFQGTIPAAFFQLSNLRILDLHQNNFSGKMPVPSISNGNSALEVLTLNVNSLTGSVPSELGQLVNLQQLDLSNNKITSTLPTTLGNLVNLQYFYVAQNPFSAAEVPTFLSKMTALKEVSLKDTQLVDGIPDFIGRMSSLIMLDLDDNRLQGSIPDTLANARNLQYLLLNRNELTGIVPASLSSLSKLTYFMIEKNKITGSASPVCARPDQVRVFSADCEGETAAVDCPCCNVCCAPGQDDCNDQVWLGDSNPIWELGYQRSGLEFDASASRTYTISFDGSIP